MQWYNVNIDITCIHVAHCKHAGYFVEYINCVQSKRIANLNCISKKICIKFIQWWANVEYVGPSLNKCYTNVLSLLGWHCKENIKVSFNIG